MPPTSHPNDPTAAGRRAVAEVMVALGVAVGLLAVMLATAMSAGHETVAGIGIVSFAVALVVAVIVVRRAQRVLRLRNALLVEERRGREQLDRTLAASRRLFELESPLEVRRHICEVAREVFGCGGVSLWEVEADHLHLLERVPWVHPYTGGDRRPIAELEGLRQSLDRAEPLWIDDLPEHSTGLTRATAEVVGTGSLLNVPVAVGGLSRLDLVLTWNERLPAPRELERLAVQRFADHAGMAIEQARYRAAQAEIASLNRTLGRMVQTDPLFHAGGTVAEVALAICSEALAVFEAGAAAVWIDCDDGIELLCREPSAGAFAARQRIAFAEHPAFRDDLEGGQPRFLADVEQEDPVLWERFARHTGSRSQLRLPLASGGHARALIVLSWTDPVPPPSAEVSALASRFADQAGVALAEAARREAQHEASELHARLEESLLPSISLASRGVSLATLYRPGDERLSLGGDFYDCLELPDGSVALLIGDVAGHGPDAAALGAGLRTAWRALVLAGRPGEEVLAGMQAVCVRERDDPYQFVTAIAGRVDSDRRVLRFVSAGHPPPIVVGVPELSEPQHGPPLGVVSNAVWQSVAVALPPRATVLLYTDGLVEGRAAPGSSTRRGLEPIEQRLASATPGAVTEVDLRHLVEAAADAHGSGLPDDVALLALNLGRP